MFWLKKTSGGTVKNKIISNKGSTEELYKPVFRKFDKRKENSPFVETVWVADIADMQLVSKVSKGFRFLLCVIGIYSKYAWIILLKDKKGLQLLMLFQKF